VVKKLYTQFTEPSNYLTLDELKHIRALYATEALLVDKWINRLIEKIEELGLFEDTAIIFTSDHGFYLGEHGLVGKSIIVGGHQGYAPLYEEVAHIPLIIKLPDRLGVKHREVSELVSTTRYNSYNTRFSWFRSNQIRCPR
jgi:arylsulfatase A-like enzyme